VIITEGTRIDRGKTNESEQRVYEISKKELLGNRKLSVIDFNFKDIDRFRTFYRISKELGKKLVISFKHACFLEKYHNDPKIRAPDSIDENILLLKPKRLTGTYIDEDYTEKYIKDRLNYPNIITAEEISEKPQDYMVVLNFWYFNTLIDLKPDGGVYIHSLSEPFNEEMEISFDRMNGADLKELILTINPKELYPIHTEHPGMFRKLGMKTKMVKEGKTYKV